MTPKYHLIAIAVSITAFGSCATSKSERQYGKYETRSGTYITLNNDQTFELHRRRHLDAVSASGHFTTNADTLILNYTDRNYDSIISPTLSSQKTLGTAFGLQKRFLWRGKRLYLIMNDNSRQKYAKLNY